MTTMKSSGNVVDGQNCKEGQEEMFSGTSAEVGNDDDLRGIWTVVPHELGRVK